MASGNVLSESEIKAIIDQLFATIGIRMNVSTPIPTEKPNNFNFLSYCNIITQQLELPIRVIPDFSSSFQTSGLTKNNANSVSEVSAQICVPSDLPWYGTPSMVGFPIKIYVGSLEHQTPEKLLTQLSHEFSHIYLHSRKDPQKDSEYATDICALMMGFVPFWKKGRTSTHQNYITTFGYLSDNEYHYAVNYINQLREPLFYLRLSLKRKVKDIQEATGAAQQCLTQLFDLFDFHYRHPDRCRIKNTDGFLFSQLSQPHYRKEKEEFIESYKKSANDIIHELNSNRVYSKNSEARLTELEKRLDNILQNITSCKNELEKNAQTIKDNIDIEFYRSDFIKKSSLLTKAHGLLEKAIHEIQEKLNELQLMASFFAKNKAKHPTESLPAEIRQLVNGSFDNEFQSYIRQFRACQEELTKNTDGVDWYNYSETAMEKSYQQATTMLQHKESYLKRISDLKKTAKDNLSVTERLSLFIKKTNK